MDHAPLSILLANDNPANQKVLSYMLKRLGHDVTIVGTGREAVPVFAEKPCDLLRRAPKKSHPIPEYKRIPAFLWAKSLPFL